jgi:hypothetical protein
MLMRADRRFPLAFAAIALLALGLRLLAALPLDPLAPYVRGGGDSWWYLANGDALVNARFAPGISTDLSTLPTPPGYVFAVGLAQAVAPGAGAVQIVRAAQAALGTAIVVCCGGLAWLLTRRRGAALLTAGLLAVSPAFVLEAGQITSETLYMALVAAGLLAYTRAVTTPHRRAAALVGAGMAFGLAGLVRAPILLFPFGLALHWLIFERARGWRGAGLLLTAYILTLGIWTAYNLAQYGRFVISGGGFAAFVYIGATGWDDPEAVDARLGSTEGGASSGEFLDQAGAVITADPLGYAARRAAELAGAILQPHGTVYYPGESIRELAVGWWRDDRTPGGLLALTGAEAFAPKLALYLFHYLGAGAAAVGLWRARGNPRVVLVLIGFVVYVVLVHLLLLALPRYIFPTAIALAPLASAALFAPQRVSSPSAERAHPS